MKTLEQYGTKKIEATNKAVKAIKDGGFFNGIIYAKNSRKKGYTELSVYVDSVLYFIGEVETADVSVIKSEILAEIQTKEQKEDFGSETEFGSHNWLFSGMNAE